MQPQKTAVVCIRQPAKMKSILSRSTLQGANFTSVRMLIEAIEAFVACWNQNAAPFEWTKAEVRQQPMKRYSLRNEFRLIRNGGDYTFIRFG
jgi:hypothetical protein